jgi:ATP-dependent Clp endopeptidase proteolytic subunit ClpP
MGHQWFRVVNQKGTVPTIYIYGVIGENWFSDQSVTCNQFVRELDDLAKSQPVVNVRINSPGGSVHDGMAIITAISQSSAEIHTYIDGVAYSMAAAIALAGRKVKASSMSRMMLHTVWSASYGNSQDMRKAADELDGYNQLIAELVAQKTGLAADEVVSRWFNYEDHYLSPSEMLSNALVDEIITVKAGAQNFGKMSFADAYDYFLQNASGIPEHVLVTDSNLNDMQLPHLTALYNLIREGRLPEQADIQAAQTDLTEAGTGLVLITAADNLQRNQQARLLSDIRAALPQDAEPLAAVQHLIAENAAVRACFADAAADGFYLPEAVRKAVADAAAFAAADAGRHERQEQQDAPPQGGSASKAVLEGHFKKVAAEYHLNIS